MGRIVLAMLAAGLALLVSLDYPVVKAVGRITGALSELAFGDWPASDEEGEAALDHDDPAATAEEQLTRGGSDATILTGRVVLLSGQSSGHVE